MNNVKLLGKEEKQTIQQPKFNSVGELLKYHRELKGLSLEKVARNTYIKVKYLAALEENLPDVMPAPVYVYSYIKHYSKLLGLDGTQMVKLYQRQFNLSEPELSVKNDIIPEDKLSFNAAGVGFNPAQPDVEGFIPSVRTNENFLKRDYIEKEKMELNTLSEEFAISTGNPEDKNLPKKQDKSENDYPVQVIANASAEAEKLIEKAKLEAEKILNDAREEAYLLKKDAQTYAENVLLALEHDLGRTIEEIRNGRSFLRKNRK